MKKLLILLLLLTAPAFAAEIHVDPTAGDDGAGTGAIGAPYLTLEVAMGDVSGGGNTIFLKNNGSHTDQDAASGASMVIDVAGTSANYNRLKGYTSTVEDSGIATIDAADSLASCIISSAAFWKIENIRFEDGTGDNVSLGSIDNTIFTNCQFISAGSDGCQVDNNCTFIRCTFEDNTAYDILADHTLKVSDSSFSNGGGGIWCDYACTLTGNWFHENAGYSIHTDQSQYGGNTIAYNTIDGGNVANTYGLYMLDAVNNDGEIVGNVFYDLDDGIYYVGSNLKNKIGDVDYNWFNSCETPRTNVAAGTNDGTADPTFTAPDTEDYTLQAGSPLINAGPNKRCIGAYGYEATGGGGAVQLVGGGLVQ